MKQQQTKELFKIIGWGTGIALAYYAYNKIQTRQAEIDRENANAMVDQKRLELIQAELRGKL
jgi:hypothetical protein